MNLLFELFYMKGEGKDTGISTLFTGEGKDTEISTLFTGEGRRKKECEAGKGLEK